MACCFPPLRRKQEQAGLEEFIARQFIYHVSWWKAHPEFAG